MAPGAEPQQPVGGGLCQPGVPFASGRGGCESLPALCLSFPQDLEKEWPACLWDCLTSAWEGPPCFPFPPPCLVHCLREDTRLLGLSQGTCCAVLAIKAHASVFPNLLLISLLGWDVTRARNGFICGECSEGGWLWPHLQLQALP